MSLIPTQERHAHNVALLKLEAERLGLIMTFGENERSPLQAWANSLPPKTEIYGLTSAAVYINWVDTVGGAGINHSTHCERRGVDVHVYIKKMDGYSEITDKETLKPLGDYWESLSDAEYKCVWGGNFKPTKNRPLGDVYHYETNKT